MKLYTGLHLDIDRVFVDNSTITGLRKGGLLVNDTEAMTKEEIKKERGLVRAKYGLSNSEV